MPSPFPGMDPYLEHPARWPGVHQRLMTYIADTLNIALPPHYVADIGERLYVVQPDRSIYPDVMISETSIPPPTESGTLGIAAVASDPPWVLTVKPEEMREVYIEILIVPERRQGVCALGLSVPDESRVVTAIEVLSPSNKNVDNQGQELYLTKQAEILSSQTHLIEIDFLRSGEHTVAVPPDMLLGRGDWDYLVCLHRGGQKEERYEVWAIPLPQRLPRIHVPLQEGDPDVVLDLQAVFNRCYDEGAYARRVDYRSESPTPMKDDDAQWADTLLREQGLRE